MLSIELWIANPWTVSSRFGSMITESTSSAPSNDRYSARFDTVGVEVAGPEAPVAPYGDFYQV